MSSSNRHLEALSTSDQDIIERQLRQFDRAWRSGERPAIEDYLPTLATARVAALVELVHTELEYRAKEGEKVSIRSYLDRFPELEQDPSIISHLSSSARTVSNSGLPRPADPMSVLAPRSLGRFRILETIGAGACGTVYRAWDSQLERMVALKVPHLGNLAAPQEAERFLREARSAAGLEHPLIVPVHEVGQADGTYFLVSNFVTGVTLAERLRRGPLDSRESARLVARVAEALHYAHERGVIHRDIKPANIIIDDDGEPHIVDFGLAYRAADATLTEHGQVLGTPAYLSPEQARGESHTVDARSDIYSLGIVLYELLTGTAPFRGAARMVLLQVLEDDPQPPHRSNDQIPRDLETICLEAIAKEPMQRYQTAAELAADLERFLAGEPVRARPIGPVPRMLRWTRRRPAVSALASLLVVTLLVLGATGTYFNFELRQQRDLARVDKNNAQLDRDAARLQTRMAERNLYAGDINLAYRRWQTRDTEEMLVLLDRHRREGSGQDLRSFEWFYLWRLCHHDMIFRGHSAMVNALAFLPDGERIASGSDDGTIRLWDIGTGQPCGLIRAHAKPVQSLALSADGRLLASASADSTVILWDIATLRPEATLVGHSKSVTAVAFAPDGNWIATGSLDRTVRLWNAGTRQQEASIELSSDERPIPGMIVSVAFSADSRSLIVAPLTAKPQIWDVASRELSGYLQGHNATLGCLTRGPDGMIATGGDDRTIRIWDVATQSEQSILTGHTESVTALSYSCCGQLIASASLDRTVRVWDSSSGREIATMGGQSGPVNCVAFSCDGSVLATAGRDNTVRLWKPWTGEPISRESSSESGVIGAGSLGSFSWEVARFKPHEGPIRSLAFSPDSENLAVGGRTGGVAPTVGLAGVWDLASGYKTAEYPRSCDCVNCLAYAPDGTLGVGGQIKNRSWVTLWDPTTGSNRLMEPSVPGTVWGLAFLQNGKSVATSGGYISQRGFITLFDCATGTAIVDRQEAGDYERALAVAPDGSSIAIGRGDGRLTIWDGTLTELWHSIEAHTQRIFGVAFAPDSQVVATACRDGTAKLWSVKSGELLATLHGHGHTVTSVAFTRDGSCVATGGGDGSVKFWDPITGQERLSLDGASGMIWSIAFSNDGRTLAAGTEDGFVLLWHAADIH